ncbi:MAG TPA: pyridine nucleotide-disulfide oxidoreductase, partial [Novosphingobium sp.]
KSVGHLRSFAAIPESFRADKAIEIEFDFFGAPLELRGAEGRVAELVVERTRLDRGRAVGTGEHYTIPASLVISCIGYQATPIPGVPFEDQAGRFANSEGRILPGLYCVGWARRGPSGTIGTNRPDGYAIVDAIAADQSRPDGRPGGEGFDLLAAERTLNVVRFRDWQKIDAAEVQRAREGAPREKYVRLAQMLGAAGKG